MNRFSVLPAVALALLAIVPQEPSGSIRGHVVDAFTEETLPGIELELTHAEGLAVVSRKTVSGRDGSFAFSDLPPGDGYELVATGAGFVKTAYGQDSRAVPWTPITLAEGQQLDDLRMAVERMTPLSGRVLDPEHDDFPAGLVVAMKPVYKDGRRILEGVASTRMNRDGEYFFPSLSPGLYYFRASVGNRRDSYLLFTNPGLMDRSIDDANRSVREREGYPVSYYPGGPIEGARPVRVSYGVPVEGVDIIVRRVETSRLRGTVVDESGLEVPGVLVLLVPQRAGLESNWTRSFRSGDGSFDFRGVIAGDYFLVAASRNQRLWGRMPLTIEEDDSTTATVTVSERSAITGRIVVPGAILASLDLSTLTLALEPDWPTPLDDALGHSYFALPQMVRPVRRDGEFSFTDVIPWDYRVIVTGTLASAPESYVRSIRSAGSDVLSAGLRVEAGSESTRVEIILGLDSGELAGQVLNDTEDSLRATTVALVPDARERRDLYQSTTADEQGGFRFAGVAPGNYTIFAWEALPDGAALDPDFVESYDSGGARVVVPVGGTTHVEVAISPGLY